MVNRSYGGRGRSPHRPLNLRLARIVLLNLIANIHSLLVVGEDTNHGIAAPKFFVPLCPFLICG